LFNEGVTDESPPRLSLNEDTGQSSRQLRVLSSDQTDKLMEPGTQ